MLMVIGTVAVVLIVAFLLLRGRPAPPPQPIPPPDAVSDEPGLVPEPAPLETVEPARSGAQRGDSAREIIAALRADPDGVDYGEAYRQAMTFLAEGRAADAQLLLFFAARGGYGPAAFELATHYDPNRFEESGVGLVEEPDAFQAYRWYGEAAAAGEQAAAQRLAELREWAERAVGEGDRSAEQLLLQWESADEL